MSFEKCPACGYHEAITAQLNAHVMNKFKNQKGGVATFNKGNDVTSFTTVDSKTGETLTWTKQGEHDNSNIKVMEQPKVPAVQTVGLTQQIPASTVKETAFETDSSLKAPPLAASPVVTHFGGSPTAPQPKQDMPKPANSPIIPETKFNP